ncbi:ABC transporter ATP-binding protein [Desulfatitalea alkaliphila]|uniref:ABC transporter ATP-binding protein n=1 Tax=Desulfatitalea alkaliphila TaxID=2929485 RepID=A0AA41UQC8_9BACT|nr:ABC transporter ATP-binding protein [Desulfatitalea alkaliphila]MCJ8501253.1 ABC transporter ATP-binding protein [Desulfatitalea alkaliphila]
MVAIAVDGLGKAFKHYPTRWARLAEWILPGNRPHHIPKWVLQDINFTIDPGEAVGIVGVNGAGKSTLLKLITGTLQPSTGTVQTHGRLAAMLELGMGFHPDFTGRQNVFMAGQLMGLGIDEIKDLLPEIEKFADIGDYIDQPVRIYSSGMQMRLAFSAATAVRPDTLIIDEAMAVGDAYFQAKCFQRIARFKQQGTTLLLVSHSVGDIVKHCERAILLKNGHVEQDGSSRQVTNRYLDELFGKSPCPEVQGSCQFGCAGTQMLNGDDDVFHTRPGYCVEEHRWGQGGGAILDYLIVAQGEHYPSRIESNAQTDFYFKVRFDNDFSSVVPGFLIKTLEGIFLYGTNSFIANEGRSHLAAEAGNIKVFRFSLPMALNEGHYLISFGISSGDPLTNLEPIERRYDSVMIHVGRTIQFWGLVDLTASFETIEQQRQLNGHTCN